MAIKGMDLGYIWIYPLNVGRILDRISRGRVLLAQPMKVVRKTRKSQRIFHYFDTVANLKFALTFPRPLRSVA